MQITMSEQGIIDYIHSLTQEQMSDPNIRHGFSILNETIAYHGQLTREIHQKAEWLKAGADEILEGKTLTYNVAHLGLDIAKSVESQAQLAKAFVNVAKLLGLEVIK